jgi:hypothetical protein
MKNRSIIINYDHLKRFEKFGDEAAVKHQYAAAINSEYRSGQLAGLYVDKKRNNP